MDTRSDKIARQAAAPSIAPGQADGVSADASRQSVASFLDKLDTVGDGLSVLTEMLKALRGEGQFNDPASPDTQTAAAGTIARAEVSPPSARTSDRMAPDLRSHVEIRKHHQDLFSLLRRVAQGEMERETQQSLPAQDEAAPDPLPESLPDTLFLGKLNVPPVDPQYRRLARR